MPHAHVSVKLVGEKSYSARKSLDSDEYDLRNERVESQKKKTQEESCEERIKGAIFGFLIAACLSLLAYNLLTHLFPPNTECPMSRYSCRKEHFLEVYKSMQVVDKFRDTNRRKILSSVKVGIHEPENVERIAHELRKYSRQYGPWIPKRNKWLNLQMNLSSF